MDDIARLRNEYEHRKQRFASSDMYSWFNTANLFAIQQRQRAVLSTLKQYAFTELHNLLIFEMGCGDGGVLTEYLGFGASPENLFGVDLVFDRLRHAHHILQGSGIANADGQFLPFPAQTFDLVLQSTALSSILDPVIRRNICADMLRVLRSPDPASGKPAGMIPVLSLSKGSPTTSGLILPTRKRAAFVPAKSNSCSPIVNMNFSASPSPRLSPANLRPSLWVYASSSKA